MPNGLENIKHKLIGTRAEKDNRTAPVKLELLITIVNRKKSEYYADLIQSFDVNMQVVTLARGTTDIQNLNYLGLNDSDKAAIFSFVREDKLGELTETLEQKFRTIKDGKGIAVSFPFSSVIGKLVYGFLSNDRRLITEEGQ